MISNRLSAKRSRDRRLQYLAEMELKIKTIEVINFIVITTEKKWMFVFQIYLKFEIHYHMHIYFQDQIACIQPQIASYKSKKSSLLMDREKLDHQVTILHEETSLKDGNINIILFFDMFDNNWHGYRGYIHFINLHCVCQLKLRITKLN